MSWTENCQVPAWRFWKNSFGSAVPIHMDVLVNLWRVSGSNNITGPVVPRETKTCQKETYASLSISLGRRSQDKFVCWFRERRELEDSLVDFDRKPLWVLYTVSFPLLCQVPLLVVWHTYDSRKLKLHFRVAYTCSNFLCVTKGMIHLKDELKPENL